VRFVFGPLADIKQSGFIFAFQALPIVVFFSALMAVLYHVGVLPAVIRAFAKLFSRTMRVSGAESLYVASQIFSGVESATAIRPYLARMTLSELHCLMVSGLATVAVNMIGTYVAILGNTVTDVAGHLMCASVLGAPTSLIAAKLIWPEDDTPETLGHVPPVARGDSDSITDAVIAGANDGVQLIVGIVALLIPFLGLMAMGNFALEQTMNASLPTDQATPINFETVLGWVFQPFAFLMGVPWRDTAAVGQLLGLRMIATEIPSYSHLAELITSQQIGTRSAVIAVYALCGFTHVASVAIYVGGTAALVPERRKDLARVAWRALLAGTFASLMTGAVAGVWYAG